MTKTDLNFELKSVNFHDDMSEETPCFSAFLYVDGLKMARISNTGCGGCNDVTPCKGFTYKDIEPFTSIDMECKIFEEVYNFDARKKHQSKGFVLLKNDMISLSKFPRPISKLKKVENYKEYVKNQTKVFEDQGYKVLNNNL